MRTQLIEQVRHCRHHRGGVYISAGEFGSVFKKSLWQYVGLLRECDADSCAERCLLAPSINTSNTNNTNNQSGDANILNIIGPQRLLFDAAIGDQLASKLPNGKSIEIMAVGSRTDWSIANQYAQHLKAKGFDVSFSRTSETVPPLDRKITIRDDPVTSPTIVIIAPSAL